MDGKWGPEKGMQEAAGRPFPEREKIPNRRVCGRQGWRPRACCPAHPRSGPLARVATRPPAPSQAQGHATIGVTEFRPLEAEAKDRGPDPSQLQS